MLEEEIKYYVQLGYSREKIIKAQQSCSGLNQPIRANKMLDELDMLQKQLQAIQNIKKQGTSDEALNEAIIESYKTLKTENVSDFSTPIERKRKGGVPVGLKNTGNTCYFNSLLQTYFMNHKFVMEVLNFKEPNEQIIKNLPSYNRIKCFKESIKLIKNLKKLFGQMILSDKKYVDPTLVLQSIVDEYGKFIPIGDQKDIGEFNIYFLTRIEEGLLTQEKYLSQQSEKNENENDEKVFFNQESITPDGTTTNFRKSMSLATLQGQQVLSSLFFGKQLQSLVFPPQAKIPEKKQEEMFSTIYLDVQFKDLYTSWEEANLQPIDYKTEQVKYTQIIQFFKGNVIQAIKQNCLISAPEILFFQLSRVKYDKEKQGLIKLNDKFNFEKEIYIDRFLLKNRDLLLKTRQTVQYLRKEAEVYETALNELNNFKKSNINLLEIMSQCENFFQLQIAGVAQKKKISELTDPTFFGVSKQSDMNTAVKQITAAKKQVEERTNKLQSKLENLNQLIDKSYDKLKSFKYKLVGLLIHEGGADSGHYYSYIFDHDQAIWRKYNDSNISTEKEETVFEMALGGKGNASAYYLIYFSESQFEHPHIETLQLSQSILQNQQLGKLADAFQNVQQANIMRAYSTSEARIADLYVNTVMQNVQLFSEILYENQQFENEIEEFQSEQAARNIIDNYSDKFSYVNEIARQIGAKIAKYEKSMQNLPVLINFPIYLKTHPCFFIILVIFNQRKCK